MAKPSVFPIRPDDVDRVWPTLSGYVNDAMSYGLQTHGLEDIRTAVKNESMRLWAILSAKGKPCGAAVTAIEEHPLLKIGVVWWLGGCDINEWFPTSQKVLASWARLNGCSVLRHAGRDGWVRYLKPFGYKKVASIVLLDLELPTERAELCQVAAVGKPQHLQSSILPNILS